MEGAVGGGSKSGRQQQAVLGVGYNGGPQEARLASAAAAAIGDSGSGRRWRGRSTVVQATVVAAVTGSNGGQRLYQWRPTSTA